MSDIQGIRCGACESVTIITSRKCTKKDCKKVTNNEALLPNALSYLDEKKAEVVIALLANDGNMTAAAEALGYSLHHYKKILQDTKAEINKYIGTISVLKDFDIKKL